MKLAIALTGGIATGKSEAAAILKRLGFAVIDADEISREVFSERLAEIEAAFGTSDRKKIADRIFANAGDRKRLEAILHPEIKRRVCDRCAELDALGKRYFADIPLFFERREDYPIVDSLLIYAPRETQLYRLIAKRGLSEAEAAARLEAQIAIDEKRKMAKWTIDNTGAIEDLRSRLEIFLKENGVL